MERVTRVAELLEAILLNVDRCTILTSQSVSKPFQSTIAGSKPLQELLGFRQSTLTKAVLERELDDPSNIPAKLFHPLLPKTERAGFGLFASVSTQLHVVVENLDITISVSDSQVFVHARLGDMAYMERIMNLHRPSARPEASWRRMHSLPRAKEREGCMVKLSLDDPGVLVSRKTLDWCGSRVIQDFSVDWSATAGEMVDHAKGCLCEAGFLDVLEDRTIYSEQDVHSVG